MRPVYITRISKFLPNDPVPNDKMEEVLGMVGDKPSKARAIVLRNNGIKTRYYALKDGKTTHTNTEIAATAVKALFDEALPIEKLEVLAAGSNTTDQLLPSHAVMVHGELGINKNIEVISATGSCCCSVQAMKYAYLAVGAGMADVAAACGSEKVSSWMRSNRFENEYESLKQLEENPYIAFEKDFLRWMLSDGAGAALLQSQPNSKGLSLKIEWLETTSYAHELDTCMYSGSVKDEQGKLIGWNEISENDWLKQSVFSIKQDTRLLSENVVVYGGKYLSVLMEKHGLSSEGVDYFLPHMSSEFFKKTIYEELKKVGMDIPYEKWFYNLTRVGNVGSASTYLMLEELFNSGNLKNGDRILVMVPESARFSYAYIYLTVVEA